MTSLRNIAGVLGLAVLLAVTSCGQSEAPQASLEVSSVPVAEIYVDGVSAGMSPRSLSLSAGTHMVELRLEKFAPHGTNVTLTEGETQKIDAILTAQDPSDPTVIAMLADAEGFEMAPFIAPETTRGASRKQVCAILLWPRRDIRKGGLVNYAIEADETYGGDATLEFRHGRKVLYREPFNPESVTTIRSIPAEVLECVRVGTKITWGLYFEDQRRPIKSDFKVVNRPKADRQLAKLARSRHMARQPEITRSIMQATILENNRLYTEALVANLTIAGEHEQSIQPYRGIVTTLRRLDAKESLLFAIASPSVSGKGGHAQFGRPNVSGRTADSGLGIQAWLPVTPSAVPTPAPGTGTARPATPGGHGVMPTQPQDDATPETTEPTPDVPTPAPDQAAEMARAVERMSLEIEGQAQELADLQGRATQARSDADAARAAAEAQEANAAEAERAATAAREAVDQAEDPTPEQVARMAEAGEQAESARETAAQATEEAQRLSEVADRLSGDVEQREAALNDLRKALDEASARLPGVAERRARDEAVAEREAAVTAAERAHDAAQEQAAAAGAEYQRLLEARGQGDEGVDGEALGAAQEAREKADAAAAKAAEDLEAARAAVAELGEQVQEPSTR